MGSRPCPFFGRTAAESRGRFWRRSVGGGKWIRYINPPEPSLSLSLWRLPLFLLESLSCRPFSITIACPTSASFLILFYPSPLSLVPYTLSSRLCPRLSITLLSSVWVEDAPRKTTTEQRWRMGEYRVPMRRRIEYSKRRTSPVSGTKKTSRRPWISG
jgi:hypothetical protein